MLAVKLEFADGELEFAVRSELEFAYGELEVILESERRESLFQLIPRMHIEVLIGHVHEKLGMFVSFLVRCILCTILKYIENHLNSDLAHG